MVTAQEQFTETVYVEYRYSDKELIEIAREVGQVNLQADEKSDALASMTKTMKAEISELTSKARSLNEKLRSGYEMRPVTCYVKYKDGVATYVDKLTGEFVKDREMTRDEQLRMSAGWQDAEQIIRQDRARLDNEETEE